jgi:3-phosphoshikimate 1-carboxyvinyltransferase
MPYVSVEHATGRLNGCVNVPSSKSISNRLLVLQALAAPNCIQIENLSNANDTLLLQQALKSIAAKKSEINIEDAGTAFRFLTAYLAIQPGVWTLTGSARLQERPIAPLVNALRLLGADICYLNKEGFAPLQITGQPLQGGKLIMESDLSSQFISALLLIAPVLPKGISITLNNAIASKSYIEMTLLLLHQAGITSSWIANEISVLPSAFKPANIAVEADWSSIAFLYELAALSKTAAIEIPFVATTSIQGDAVAMEYFKKYWNVDSQFMDGRLLLTKTKQELTNTAMPLLDFSSTPDLVQAWLATCTGACRNTQLSGIAHLQYKESNRLEALKTELAKVNGIFEWKQSTFDLNCRTLATRDLELHFETYNDHRMAMAFAPLCLKIGKVFIENPACVQKSFPNYWQELQALGFVIRQI